MTMQSRGRSPDDLSASIHRASRGAFAAGLEIGIEQLGPGRMVGRMVLQDQPLIEAGGLVHAGTVFGLADTCAGWGCLASLPEGMHGFATIEAKINLIATTGQGDTLVATAVMEHSGRTTQVWNVEVGRQREPRKIGLYRCTQMLLPATRGE
jgi:1,4-dihydroxy-2-naphthoyl-CoA hydrolase